MNRFVADRSFKAPCVQLHSFRNPLASDDLQVMFVWAAIEGIAGDRAFHPLAVNTKLVPPAGYGRELKNR